MLAPIFVLILLSACALEPVAPLQQEREVGAPLPYEPPHTGVQSAPLLPAVKPKVVIRAATRKKWIALTFDACSTQGPGRFDDKVIRTLIDQQVPATLFLGGKWMEEHPDETQELANYPQFELANHTYLHPHLTHVSNERVREELQRTQDMLFTLTGRTARLFRAPYGEIDDRVARVAGQLGMTAIQYDLASGDPDPKISAKRLADVVAERAKGGSIVVLHMNGRGWHTADALPRMIMKLRKQGFKFKTVGELIGLPGDKTTLPAESVAP